MRRKNFNSIDEAIIQVENFFQNVMGGITESVTSKYSLSIKHDNICVTTFLSYNKYYFLVFPIWIECDLIDTHRACLEIDAYLFVTFTRIHMNNVHCIQDNNTAMK